MDASDLKKVVSTVERNNRRFCTMDKLNPGRYRNNTPNNAPAHSMSNKHSTMDVTQWWRTGPLQEILLSSMGRSFVAFVYCFVNASRSYVWSYVYCTTVCQLYRNPCYTNDGRSKIAELRANTHYSLFSDHIALLRNCITLQPISSTSSIPARLRCSVVTHFPRLPKAS